MPRPPGTELWHDDATGCLLFYDPRQDPRSLAAVRGELQARGLGGRDVRTAVPAARPGRRDEIAMCAEVRDHACPRASEPSPSPSPSRGCPSAAVALVGVVLLAGGAALLAVLP